MEDVSGTESTLRVLLIEDNPGDRLLVDALLARAERPTVNLRQAASLQAGLALLGQHPFDAILLDLFLPDARELEALERVRTDFPDVAIVVLTMLEAERLGIQALQSGAQDYLSKTEITPDTLIRSLRFAVERARRLEAERAFQRGTEHFRALIENSSDIITIVNPDGTVRYESPSVQRVLGYRPGELEGKDVLEYFHPDDRERVRAQMAELATGTRKVVGQGRFRHNDGTWRTLESTGSNLLGNPAVRGLVVNSRDVTERLLAEEREREHLQEQSARQATEEARRRLEEILESITDAFFAFDPEWRLTYLNRRAEMLLRTARDELLGKTILEIYPPLESTPQFAEFRRAMQERTPLDVEYPSVLAPGNWFHFHVAPMHDGAVLYVRDITARKRAQEALARKRERLQEAQRVAQIGSWEWDRATQTVTWSDEQFRIRGHEPQAFVPTYEAFLQTVHPEDLPRMRAITEQLMRSPTRWEGEYRVVHPDGSVRLLRARKEPVLSETGDLIGSRGIEQDITGQRAAEETLYRLSAALDSSMDGICIVSGAGYFEYTNEAKAKTFGFDAAADLVGRSWRELYPAEEVQRIEDEVLPLFELSGWWRGEVLAKRTDGTTFPSAVSMTRLPGEDAWIAVDWDETPRKQAEDELRRRSELVRLLQMAAIAANESASLEQALDTVVEQVCRFTDLAVGHAYAVDPAAGDLVPTGIWCSSNPERFGPFTRATMDTRLAPGEGLPGSALAGRKAIWIQDLAGEVTFRRIEAASEANLHSGLAAPVFCGTEVVAVLEFFLENTAPPDSLLLETLANVGVQLGRVAERARADVELRTARREAERANHAKSEFLGRMSHELRTPLNAILGFGQLLEVDVEDAGDRESVEQILAAGRHLLGLVNEVLDLARIEAGEMSISVEPVSAHDAVTQSLDLVRHMAAAGGIALPADVRDCNLFVAADLQRLKQVLLNLLSNAIKYNRPGGSVSVRCETRPAGRVRIVVEDTGPGLTADKMERLFRPFERLDQDQGRVEGTGLGLALSRGLMEAMGGSLGVESESGKGSRFWAELSLAPEPSSATASETDSDGQSVAPGVQHTHTVLLVEDNLANVRLIERVMSRRPHVRLIVAMQGSVALDLARQHRPGLILLDLNLPDLSGREVLTRIRNDPALRHIPVVMISGDAMPQQIERIKAEGAHAYITKPFNVLKVLQLVDEILA